VLPRGRWRKAYPMAPSYVTQCPLPSRKERRIWDEGWNFTTLPSFTVTGRMASFINVCPVYLKRKTSFFPKVLFWECGRSPGAEQTGKGRALLSRSCADLEILLGEAGALIKSIWHQNTCRSVLILFRICAGRGTAHDLPLLTFSRGASGLVPWQGRPPGGITKLPVSQALS